ncbi:MAG: hypothetical protein ACKO7W_09130 [Elainella sp.]
MRRGVRVAVLSLALACLISLTSWMVLATPPSSAAPRATDTQIEEREQAYEQAKAIAEDPKRGVEKEYEKEEAAYEQEHGGEGGLVDKAKALAAEAAGTAQK